MPDGDLFDDGPAEPKGEGDSLTLFVESLAYSRFVRKGLAEDLKREHGLATLYDAAQALKMEYRKQPQKDSNGNERFRPTIEEVEAYLNGGRERMLERGEARSHADRVAELIRDHGGSLLAEKIGVKPYEVQQALMAMSREELESIGK